MARKTVSFRLPESIVQAIEEHAKATGKSKTTLFLEVLTRAYGFSQPASQPITPKLLKQQLEQLKQQVETVMIVDQNAPAERGYAAAEQDLLARILSQTKVFDQIFSALPDPLFVCDRQGRIAYINLTGSRMLKIERSQALGRHCQEMDLPPDVMARLNPQLEMALMHGRFSRGEFSCHTASQTRYYEYSLNPFFSNEDTIDGIVGIARDTTYYKQIETELRDAQEQYRKLFELANDWMFIIDASTDQILEANSQASRRLGYTRKEICRQSFVDISSPAAAAYYQTAIVPDLERMGGSIFDHALRHRNGQEIHVEISGRLIEYQDQLVFEFSARELDRE
ncbi:MAG: PAS domain S-box protein [Leptolyngbyaceae cyanobacterium MO_188.B28]|nr:PAS domain S-box protein [Leptolyngbyaceae cyanobacterium MO_188.B28]